MHHAARVPRLEAPGSIHYGARMSPVSQATWTLRCDGGSRGNPGPGALGYVLVDPRGREVDARGEALGVVTNNVAEYRALIAGLESAVHHRANPLTVCMDSELVVRQMTGEYRVKHSGLKPLHVEAKQMAARLGSVRYLAVGREANARADQLVNETLDRTMNTNTESPR